MEINYDLIIKYLVNKDKTNKLTNTFTTQKNIYTYSTEWNDKFKELFTDKFYRYGVLINDNDNNNISFWASIIMLLYEEFVIPYNEDEITIINDFKNQLLEKYSNKKLSNFIKGFDKNDFRERFRLIADNNVLQYIVDILNINIIILDFKNIIIKSVYSDESLNPWKQTIILSNYDNYWEPVMMLNTKNEVQRLFDYNNVVIKKILYTNNLIIYNSSDKIFSIINDINYVLENENKKINNVEINIKYDSKKLNKMKLSELFELTQELKINVEEKRPTKAILINLIMNK